jgi:hypothetical protein
MNRSCTGSCADDLGWPAQTVLRNGLDLSFGFTLPLCWIPGTGPPVEMVLYHLYRWSDTLFTGLNLLNRPRVGFHGLDIHRLIIRTGLVLVCLIC